MEPLARTLVIGLDSADRHLIWQLQGAGRLPVIRSLIERGRSGVLQSPLGLGDDATWASFATCVSPGRHGRYFFKHPKPGTYSTPRFRDEHLLREPFWKTLSDAGRRVAVLDVPKSPLCQVTNGVQLVDWLVHGRDGETRSWPADFADDVLRRFGDDEVDQPGNGSFDCDGQALSDHRRPAFLRSLSTGLQHKTTLANELLSRGAWDLFLVVFKESHCVGHQCWHDVDRQPRSSRREGEAEAERPVQDLYQALDRSIGEVLGQVDDRTNVVLFSDLGMSANHTAEHLLEQALLRLEQPFPGAMDALYTGALRLERRLRKALLPGTVRSLVRRTRRAFQLEHNEISGAIRLNLRGREPSGRVTTGEVARLCASLESDLMDLVDPETGQPVVERVIRTDECYPGEGRDNLPDLFVVWRRDRPITGLASEKVGVIRAPDPGLRTGNHISDGFYVAAGPAFTASGNAGPRSIMDVGPTVAALLGVELQDVDGKPFGGT